MNEKAKKAKKILLVEDEPSIFKLLEKKLEKIKTKDIAILWANNLTRAKEIFEENKETLNLIVLDACVPGKTINTVPFLE